MRTGTRTQVSILLLILLFVAGASAAATFIGTKDHSKDHLAIDVINYQRLLTAEISLLVLANTSGPAIEQSINEFQQNMAALSSGGMAVLDDGVTVTLDDETDPAIHETASQVRDHWSVFRDDAREVAALAFDHPDRVSKAVSLQAHISPLAADLEALALSYEGHMESDLRQLRLWQLILLLSTIPLLLYGIAIVRRRVMRLSDLISGLDANQGNQILDPLSQEVYSDEVADLVHSFVRMRPVISAAQQSLEDRTLQRTRRLISAFEYSQQIVSLIDKHEILRHTMNNAQLFVSAKSIALCLIEANGSLLELSAINGEFAANIAEQSGRSVGHPYQIRPLKPGDSLTDLCSDCYFTETCNGDGALSVPLKADANQIGTLCVFRESKQPFDEDERQGLQLLANSAAIAISNYRLVNSSRHRERKEAISDERERLTAILHDNLAQTLGYLNLKADRVIQMASNSQSELVLDELTSMKSATGSAYDSVRDLLASLSGEREAKVINASLNIKAFITDYRQITGLDVILEVDEQAVTRLSLITQQQAYYIIRESLTNIARYAEASAVTVQVFGEEDGIQLVVRDNGRGFDPDQQLEGTHLGLTIMQARARRGGGTLVIDSRPNEGTLISTFLPFEEFETIDAN